MKNPIKVIKPDGSYYTSETASKARVSASTIIYVDNVNGNDTFGDGSYEKPFKTVLKGFQSKPTDPQWIVTNPAYRVNFATGNDGTGARFGGKFATISGAMNHGSYTQGDTIYVEAGSTSGSFTFGGRDFFFEDGVSITQTSSSHCFVSSSYTNRDYAVAGNLSMTFTSTTGLVVWHDTAFKAYFQFKSLSFPASYSSHIFQGTATSSAGNMYVWMRTDLDRSTGSPASGNILYSTSADCEFRGRNVITNGDTGFRTTGTGNLGIYMDSLTASGSAKRGFFATNGSILAVVRGNVSSSGCAFACNGGANLTAYVNGNITSSDNTIINEGTGLLTLVSGGTIYDATGGQATVRANIAGSRVDVTAKRIQRNDTNFPVVVADTSTSSVKIRNADVRGADLSSNRGPVMIASGATLEIYDCILRSPSATPQPSVKETSAGSATVTWFGTNQISDAVHAGITEVNTGNRTINSALRY